MNRQEVQDKYINAFIDSLNTEERESMLFDLMDSSLDNLSDDELIAEIKFFDSAVLN